MRKLKPEQRVTYEAARLLAWDSLDRFDPVPASSVGAKIWPDANMTGQGLGGAASRILKRMQAEGLAYWTVRHYLTSDAWGWVRSGERPEPKECIDCGDPVTTGDVCGFCGSPLHPDAPPGQLGRCTSNHQRECDQNPDNE